ncbi:MAG: cyclopropane-fatty-acyl-phospholipid synthase family protein [Acidimicrobiales bacterium]|nr:cyclopropane-fatty-acyl-phospholipid synthase family protein [Acidimicrobiales bacterium]
MSTSVRPTSRRPHPRRTNPADHAARSAIFALLDRIQQGRITVEDPIGTRTFGPPDSNLAVTVAVPAIATYRAVLLRGSAGMGEAYVDGWWDCDDLPTLVRILARNLPRLDRVRNGIDRFVSPATDLVRRLRPEDPHRDRLNISAHYDLGNEFFELFLDDTMMYSSAWFADPADTLADASTAKLERICAKLDLGPDDHVVEIGTGWGGFAVHAAREHGCRVTTTTISAEQEHHARRRVAAEGLDHLVTVLGDDYRDLAGTYDALVSIEMIEAVDWREHDRFFATCGQLLRPGGRMALQAIVLPDQRYERAKTTQDFIKRYVFPGGCLPSVEAMVRSTARSTDLALTGLEDMGQHYALTLARWRERLFKQEARLGDLEIDEAFLRLWDFYFAYCEGAFAERYVSVVQATFARPDWRPAAIAAPTRSGR